MMVKVNGREMEVPPETTVRELIVRLDLGKAACAAEVNKELVARREHESRRLREGDEVELVSLIGGG
jgi:thiamine biosynthesis protein ThiS